MGASMMARCCRWSNSGAGASFAAGRTDRRFANVYDERLRYGILAGPFSRKAALASSTPERRCSAAEGEEVSEFVREVATVLTVEVCDMRVLSRS